jgi:hypothetical protein
MRWGAAEVGGRFTDRPAAIGRASSGGRNLQEKLLVAVAKPGEMRRHPRRGPVDQLALLGVQPGTAAQRHQAQRQHQGSEPARVQAWVFEHRQ